MGSGIAQVAATCGHEVVLVDVNADQLQKAQSSLNKVHDKLVEKQKISEADKAAILGRIQFSSELQDFENCNLIIEAIIENLDIKKKVFAELEANHC